MVWKLFKITVDEDELVDSLNHHFNHSLIIRNVSKKVIVISSPSRASEETLCSLTTALDAVIMFSGSSSVTHSLSMM